MFWTMSCIHVNVTLTGITYLNIAAQVQGNSVP